MPARANASERGEAGSRGCLGVLQLLRGSSLTNQNGSSPDAADIVFAQLFFRTGVGALLGMFTFS